MDDFQVLISSFGESAVAYIGKSRLRSLHITGDEMEGTAFVQICLMDNTWAAQSAVIDAMIEIRQMFIDELAIDYRFIDEDSSTREALDAQEKRAPSFVMA